MEYQFVLRKVQKMSGRPEGRLLCFLVLEGAAELRIAAEKVPLQANDFVLVNPFQNYELAGNGENLLMLLRLPADELSAYFPAGRLPIFQNVLPAADSEIKKSISEVLTRLTVAELTRTKSGKSLEAEQYLFAFLQLIEKAFPSREALQPPVFSERLAGALQYLQQHFRETISLQTIASELNISYYHASHLFTEELGISFSHYLNQIRLEHAAADLLHSEAPILRGALENGFANVKTFYRSFKSVYKLTPKAYREQHETAELPADSADEYRDLSAKEAIERLANYLVGQDISLERAASNEAFQLTLGDAVPAQTAALKRIVRLGQAENGLRANVTRELRLLQQTQHFEFAAFHGFCREEYFEGDASLTGGYLLNNQWFDFLQEVGLTPLIELELPRAEAFSSWLDQVSALLLHFRRRYGLAALERWHFLLTADLSVPGAPQYRTFYRRIKKIAPACVIGIDCWEETDLQAFLSEQRNYLPAFFWIEADPYRDSETKKVYSQDFRRLQKEMADAVQTAARQFSDYRPALFLLDWNTLAGEGDALSGTFFRSALILESLAAYAADYSAISFWLDVKVKEQLTNQRQEHSMSLFLYEGLKRPVYFVLEFLSAIQEIIQTDPRGVIFGRSGHELAILLYNSSYLDPESSISSIEIEKVTKQFTLHLAGLPAGMYQVRRCRLDKDHGGIYNDWLRTGGVMDLTPELFAYLDAVIRPALDFQKRSVSEREPLHLEATLTLNACELILLTKQD